MSPTYWLYIVATVLFAIGMWLLLPRGGKVGRFSGVGFAGASLLLFAMLVPLGLTIDRGPSLMVRWFPSGGPVANLTFIILAGVTVVSAIGSVTFRSPVYCAIWFAMTLLGVAGLMMYQGAQFLGVATIVVYAGAILVTFLFVLMLAQPQGHTFYDRISWEGFLSACAGALMVGILTATLGMAFHRSPSTDVSRMELVGEPSVAELEKNIMNGEHMALLGRELFSKHLIAVEIAGLLLFAALVGAVAIVAQTKGVGPRIEREPVRG